MQTMRRGHDEGGGRPLEHFERDAAVAGAMESELPEQEDDLGGPWGGAAKWAAPMQEVRVFRLIGGAVWSFKYTHVCTLEFSGALLVGQTGGRQEGARLRLRRHRHFLGLI